VPDQPAPQARVLLLSTYELGHQPLGLAASAAALRARGHAVECIDLAVEPLDEQRVRAADFIALSMPMHTAARLALGLVPRLRALNPGAAIALYGLYAGLLDGVRVSGLVDAVAGGEYEPALCDLASAVAAGGREAPPSAAFAFERQRCYPVPDRSGLPPLERYARLRTDDGLALAGYVEATRGCAHHCGHCPVTAAYGGRLRLVEPETVLADIDQQVALGAAHITFGDPDFLNAVPHSLAIAEQLHHRHPALTFDVTVKVEHLLEHAALLPRLRALGCLFVTSAFESTSDEVLRQLDKGHAGVDLDAALDVCRRAGLALRPTWVMFTPWTTAEDVADQLAFIEAHGLVERVAPVQYGLRLLVPPGSALIEPLRAQGLLGDYDAEALTYGWSPIDPRIDALHRTVAGIVAAGAGDPTEGNAATFGLVRRAALEAAGRPSLATADAPRQLPATPGLTEHWFC
jgi:radical SAM superfamily enzyme YgiQ (UPF0313 family)